ncbi:MAG TPA: histidine-type phosphatase [Steroidobacteraceae bacterium]|nr:histidine-type phosphatase [Steroidobacteraceae bacterium]
MIDEASGALPRRSLRLCALATLLLAASLSSAHAAPVAAGPWVLERAVLLQRHGVRAPTEPPAALARYSAQPWPQWSVGPGELTDGGRRALAAMASYIRARYAGLGLLPRSGCPASGGLYVWADSADQRTRASGAIMAAGLAPGCSINAQHAVTPSDPLFHSAGICPLNVRAAQAQVMARANGNLNARGPRYERARRALQAVLWPGVRDCDAPGARCSVMHGRNRLSIAHGKLKLTGPLEVGASLAENLLLEYTDGLPSSEVGWGRAASPAQLAQILPLHAASADLMRRTPEMAASGGTPLAHLMLLFLEERPTAGAFAAAPSVPATAGLVVLAGHDTNLANVGSILGLDWTLPDEPDSTAPDTTLALELWRNAHDGRHYVRAVVLYQTLVQLRAEAMSARGDPHVPAAHALPLTFPGCTSSRCPLGVVRARIESRMSRNCAQ